MVGIQMRNRSNVRVPRPRLDQTTPWKRAEPTRPNRREFVYSPFPVKFGVRPLGTSWVPHGQYTIRRYTGTTMQLGDVDPQNDMLYIVGHCHGGGSTISDNAGETIDAWRLARRLRNEGLKAEQRVISLYACEGGLRSHQSEYAAQMAPNLPSFHEQLFAELRNWGFWDVELYSYLAKVTSLDARGGQWATRFGEIIGTARQVRVTSDRMQGTRRGLAPR